MARPLTITITITITITPRHAHTSHDVHLPIRTITGTSASAGTGTSTAASGDGRGLHGRSVRGGRSGCNGDRVGGAIIGAVITSGATGTGTDAAGGVTDVHKGVVALHHGAQGGGEGLHRYALRVHEVLEEPGVAWGGVGCGVALGGVRGGMEGTRGVQA